MPANQPPPESVRTRFAPSPTGYLHVGGVRTALFAWLVAKQARGQFILRIEDTDRSRHVKESEEHIQESLKWLGLDWNEGLTRQSERLEIYQDWAKRLIDAGRAYADPYTPQELDNLRQKASSDKRPFLFRDHRPTRTDDWRPGLPLRFKSEPRAYEWPDEVMGDLSAGPEVVDDFILIKSDGFPTYNFAHIVDDHESGVTHVIRSQEFLPSVPKFLNLYEALGIERPHLATLPYVLGPDGKKKLSKRDGAKDILDYRQEGFLPEAMISFLASLGWNDGTEQEIYKIDELVEKFSLKRVQRSGARFDEQRLHWVNGHFIRQTPLEELYRRSEDFWPDSSGPIDENYKKQVLSTVKERLKFMAELPQLTEFFFEEPPMDKVMELYQKPVDRKLKSVSLKDVSTMLRRTHSSLSKSDFTESDIALRLNDLLEILNSKPGKLFAAIRIAVTGSPVSPEIAATLEVLGKDRSLNRLQKTIDRLDAQA